MSTAQDTRWIILGTDGRHVTVGRRAEPSPEEVSEAERALVAQGLSGWLAVMKGGYHVHRKPSLTMARPLANPLCLFEEAGAAFEAARQASLVTISG